MSQVFHIWQKQQGEWYSRSAQFPIVMSKCTPESQVVWDRNLNEGFSWIPKLNIGESPIADKYCEGKVKRTLKKELNRAWNC